MFLWKRYWERSSDRNTECIIEKWLQRRQSARDMIEPQIEGKPTTSTHQETTPQESIRGDEKQYDAPSTSTTRSANEVQQPRSIMRTSVSTKSKATTVTFAVPEKLSERRREPEKLSYLARFKRFCNNASCRMITYVVIGILLPCCLIFVTLWYLYRLSKTKGMLVRGRLNS